MALGVRPLFSQKWVDGLRRIPEAAMSVEVAIYTVVSGSEDYDADTDTWDETTITHYLGKARVQPVRTARLIDQPGNAIDLQNVLISLPVSEITEDLRPGMQLRVTSAPLNPTLTSFKYTLNQVMDSGNIIERTIYARVDQESVNG